MNVQGNILRLAQGDQRRREGDKIIMTNHGVQEDAVSLKGAFPSKAYTVSICIQEQISISLSSYQGRVMVFLIIMSWGITYSTAFQGVIVLITSRPGVKNFLTNTVHS